jgi:hypothetical protein
MLRMGWDKKPTYQMGGGTEITSWDYEWCTTMAHKPAFW